MFGDEIPPAVLTIDWALTTMGHRGLPQSSFAPRHCRNIQAGGASTTSIDFATSSSSPVTLAGSTVDSHATLFGRLVRDFGVTRNS